ncbi:MAG: hypothetical protein OEZ58_15605 [Gammaproteobacteria bacterium]|nr:hypothetical protein [Gammaproteobacteria bacterium]
MEHAVALLQVVVWPATLLLIVFTLRSPISKILDQIANAKKMKMSIGDLTIQADTMQELHRSIDLSFDQHKTLNKSEIEALINTKIRGIHSLIDHEIKKTGFREDKRKVEQQKIKIITRDGNVHQGETLDVSEAGVGFKSKGKLQFLDEVQISPLEPLQTDVAELLKPLTIVRIEQSDEGYHYGAKIPQSA